MKRLLTCDVCVIGGGVIGLSVARALSSKFPKIKITILEKEASIGMHASGRNSGVLHAGFYYNTNTLKDSFCS
jgi:L-2-hydroxyglutarate oxidase LhgO